MSNYYCLIVIINLQFLIKFNRINSAFINTYSNSIIKVLCPINLYASEIL